MIESKLLCQRKAKFMAPITEDASPSGCIHGLEFPQEMAGLVAFIIGKNISWIYIIHLAVKLFTIF